MRKQCFKLFELDNSWQHMKRKAMLTSFAIIVSFGSINLYKNGDETWQRFLENLVLYIYKDYKPLLTCKNMWLMQVTIASIPFYCVFFLFLSYETCASCNGHKDHGITCATTSRICN